VANLTKEQLAALTRLGAQARIAELVAEEDAIVRTYPDLAGRRPRRSGVAPLQPAGRPRKPYRMSPAKRKAAAERMRAYWAARREAKQQPAAEAAPPQPARKAPKARKARRGRKAAKKPGAKKR
jgi:hypothetical protein